MNDELLHYGVKGMKWGRRKSDIPSRKELKRLNKEQELKFYAEKTKETYKDAQKNPDNVYLTKDPVKGNAAYITGADLVKHLDSGGALNTKYTDLAGKVNKDGSFNIAEGLYSVRYSKLTKKNYQERKGGLL